MTRVRNALCRRLLPLPVLVVALVGVSAAVAFAVGSEDSIRITTGCFADDDDGCDDDDDGGLMYTKFIYEGVVQTVSNQSSGECLADPSSIGGPLVQLSTPGFIGPGTGDKGLGVKSTNSDSRCRFDFKAGPADVLEISLSNDELSPVAGKLIKSVDFYFRGGNGSKVTIQFFLNNNPLGNPVVYRSNGRWVGATADGLADSVRVTTKRGSSGIQQGYVNLVPANPVVAIDKVTNGSDPTDDDPNYVPVGDTVTWTYLVTNEGNVPLDNVVVTDDGEGTIAGPESGDTNGDGYLDLTETWVYTHTGTALAAGVFDQAANNRAGGYTDLTPYTNVGTVEADSVYGGSAPPDSDGSGYFGSDASIFIDVESPGVVTIPDPATWTVYILNNGNVPLSAVLVKDDGSLVTECRNADGGADIPDCDLPDLDPGQDITILYDEPTDGENPDESSVFTVEAQGADGTTTSRDSGTVTFTLNHAPVAVDDNYMMNERSASDPDSIETLTVPATGVLGASGGGADIDEDGDDLTTVEILGGSSNLGGSVNLGTDGSFDYTPAEYDWGTGASQVFEYTDFFDYTVSDGNATDIGRVTVTVKRVVCSGEFVVGEDPLNAEFFGRFTLIPNGGTTPCKNYSVSASETANQIILDVPAGQGNAVYFRGEIQGSPEDLNQDGELVLGLEYDDEPPYTAHVTVQPCDGTPTLVDGLVTWASIPLGESWCVAHIETSIVDGQFVSLFQLFGTEDPSIRFR